MKLHRLISRGAAAFALAALAPLACAQNPVLTSLQSGLVDGSPTNGAAITAGTNISGFTLYLNGTFHIGTNTTESVTWSSAAHGPSGLQLFSTAPTLITAFVPATQFNVADLANVTVTEITGANPHPIVLTSNSLVFTVNPPMALPSTGALLPLATVGSLYSANFFAGGTGPFNVELNSNPPPGMNLPNQGNPIVGTPTVAGVTNLEFLIQDSWQNQADLFESFAAYATPTLTAISPFQAVAGSGPLTLTLTGANFVSTNSILNIPMTTAEWGGGSNPVALATTFVDSSHLSAVIPATLLTAVGVTPVFVLQPGGSLSNSLNFTVTSPILPLQIQVPGGLTATVSAPFDLKPTATGGTPPYSWSASGLPPGLGINRSTGEISGSPSQTGSFGVVLTITDSTPGTAPLSAAARFGISVVAPPQPPLQISGATLPSGTVGQPYGITLYASGGAGNPYTFSVSAGSLPAGLTLAGGGSLYGTPTTPGASNFTVQASDSSGNTATASFSITINPATLAITTGALSPVQLGGAVNVKFAATGGVPPYTFSLGGTTAPPGTQLGSDGTLSGTASTAGSYTFRVTVTDTAKNTATQSFTQQVNAAPLTVATTPLALGMVGSPYSARLAASGGTPPYSWSVTGLPAGLGATAAGAISGTPSAAGSFSLTVAVTDSAGAHATATLSLTVAPATVSPLTILAPTLPPGLIGAQYGGQFSATGGTPPYTWVVTGLPTGLTANSSGLVSGSAGVTGTFTLTATVTDAAGASATGTYSLFINGPLFLLTSTLPNATVGSAYSTILAASGGTSPYTFTVTGLPPGITASTGGTLSGTPTTAGTFSLTVKITDSAQTSAQGTLSLLVALPTAPALNFIGAPPTSGAATQSSVQIGLAAVYPVAITVNLTLSFTPTSGADDPAVQFGSGGRTAQVTIPAGSTVSSTSVGVQTGTVAGTITITAQLLAGSQNVTPNPAPKQTITINSGPPVITTVTATRNSTGFTVTIVGYATTRSVTQALFQFTAASGSTLQSTSATVSTDPLFSAWYTSTTAAPYGGQFTLTQPFTVSGSPQSIVSVMVTLVDALGNSNVVSANLQ